MIRDLTNEALRGRLWEIQRKLEKVIEKATLGPRLRERIEILEDEESAMLTELRRRGLWERVRA